MLNKTIYFINKYINFANTLTPPIHIKYHVLFQIDRKKSRRLFAFYK